MKKLITISMSFLMVMFFSTSNARESKRIEPNAGKNNVNESKIERKVIREDNRNEVSDFSKDAFKADFGNVTNVTWERQPLYDVASFTKNGKRYQAFYDNTSTLVGTMTSKKYADLPKKAQNEIKKQYKGFSVDKVIFYKDNEANDYNIELYGVQYNNNDNYFVELSRKKENVVLEVSPQGTVSFYRDLEHT